MSGQAALQQLGRACSVHPSHGCPVPYPAVLGAVQAPANLIRTYSLIHAMRDEFIVEDSDSVEDLGYYSAPNPPQNPNLPRSFPARRIMMRSCTTARMGIAMSARTPRAIKDRDTEGDPALRTCRKGPRGAVSSAGARQRALAAPADPCAATAAAAHITVPVMCGPLPPPIVFDICLPVPQR